MARIHAGRTRLSNRTLAEALSQAAPGDEIIVHEGQHTLESVPVKGVHLTGSGDPGQVVVTGQLNIWGQCRITGLTLRAPHFKNCLYLRDSESRVDLTGVTVHGDQAKKYPAVYCVGGTVVMASSSVHAAAGAGGLVLMERSRLHARDSALAELTLNGGHADLINSRADFIGVHEGGRVEGHGWVAMTPPDDRLTLRLSGESVCSLPDLTLDAHEAQARCEDSFLELGEVRVRQGEGLLVLTHGHSVVETTSEAVTVRDPDATPPGPKVVPWPLADARSFHTAVAPHLQTGDTVQLEAGHYFLDDCEQQALGIAVTLVGAGPSTVVHGKLYVMADQEATVRDLVIRAPGENNGISNAQGRALTLQRVVLERTDDAFPILFAGAGTTTLEDCTIVADPAHRVTSVDVGDGASLQARDSSLGWLSVTGATATLSGGDSLQLAVGGGGTVVSHDGHTIRANTDNAMEIFAADGATITMDSITTDATDFMASVRASRLGVGWLQTPDDCGARIQLLDGGTARVEGPAVTVLDEDAPTSATPATGRAASAPADEGGEAPSHEAPSREVAPEGDEDPPADEDGTDEGDPLERIDALVGLTTVKKQIRAFTQMVQFNQLRAAQGKAATGMTMHSLFLGNPGTGKTTVARLLHEALRRSGAISTDAFIEAGRRDLVGETIGASANLTHAVLERARGGVLFIDEAYSLYQKNNNEFAQEAVDTLLAFMENHRDEVVVILAGYPDRMQDLLRMNPGLESRVPNRFDFEDYTPDEIAQIGHADLVAEDYTVDADVYRRTVISEYRRSADRSNGRWVRNFNQDLVTVVAQRVLSAPDPVDVSRILDEDLHTLAGGSTADKEERVRELLAELDALVGLAPVKEWARRLVNRVKVDQKRLRRDGSVSRPSYHMVFAGNPGTGKTTVARIVAELFHNLGILQNPTVKQVDRSHLVGGYIGHTEEQTAKVLDEAMGGVLFVDEAYQLHLEDMPRDFGRQAIETLIPRLEDDREKFVAIFAGYSADMDRFLGANPGLRSRIPERIEFPDYSPDEVAEIVLARLSDAWVVDEEHVRQVTSQVYADLPVQERSNGRWARIFVERIEAEQSEYLSEHDVPDEDLDVIPTEVVDRAAAPTGG